MELINSGPAYVHFLVMSNELSTPKILVCPEDSEKINATTFSGNAVSGQFPFTDDRYLSYFVGVDANEAFPQALLSGDRNLAVDRVPMGRGMQRIWTNSTITWFKPRGEHMGGGNIGLADGSVQSVTAKRLQAILEHAGMATNRLIVP
jgi:prepilin-type processing-associated H-X9-DG protein